MSEAIRDQPRTTGACPSAEPSRRPGDVPASDIIREAIPRGQTKPRLERRPELGEDPEAAIDPRFAEFRGRCVLPVPHGGEPAPFAALELISTIGGNLRIRHCLDEQLFQRHLAVMDYYNPSVALPRHDVIVNLIANAEASRHQLARAQALAESSGAPVVNAPAAVLATSRCEVARRLSGVAGLVVPRTVSMTRESLSQANASAALRERGLEFPLLLRAPGSHEGKNFLKLDSPADLPAALGRLAGGELIAVQWLDATGNDGKTRKYRAMMIDGALYPLHAAVSRHWKIHYSSAEMSGNAAHRAEDAEFLLDMRGVLGDRAMAALEEAQRILGLDYGGIDFGLNGRGEALLFEANAAMGVFAPDGDPRWEYRRAPVERIYDAVRTMVADRTRRPGWRARRPGLGTATYVGNAVFLS